MSVFVDRMIRAAKLDVMLYEEVEADESAFSQAMGVVVLSSLASGISLYNVSGIRGIIMGILVALTGWFLWAYITYFIGTRLFPEPQTKSSPGELLRTIGFSSSPGLLLVFGILPLIRGIVYLVVSVWMLVAMIIAVRQALDYTSTLRAVGVCIVGWLIRFLLYVLLFLLF